MTSENKQHEDSNIAFDASPSKRRKDENGFLHVDDCPITKEQVVAYYGAEIPGWQGLGLEANKRYMAYRPAEEIKKAADTFNGVPLLLQHAPESASKPTDQRIGSVGTSAYWDAPYLRNKISVTVKDGIDAIETGRIKQLSASYRYTPVFEPGSWNGIPYDFRITNMRANHHAVVETARAGSDHVVSDSAPPNPYPYGETMSEDEDKSRVEKQEVNAASAIEKMAELILSLHKETPGGGVRDVNEDSKQEKPAMDKDEKKANDSVSVDEIIEVIKKMPAEDSDKIRAVLANDEDKEKKDKAEDEDKKDSDKANDEDKSDKKAEDEDKKDKAEDEDKKDKAEDEKEDKAMDSTAIFMEISARNALAEKLQPVLGNFAFDSMSLKALAQYAAKELKLDAPKGQEMTAINAYLKAWQPQKTVVFASDAMPGKGSGGANQINKKYGG